MTLAFLGASVAVRGLAQNNPAGASSDGATAPGVADVVRMLDAGVSKDVVKAYIDNSPSSFDVSPTDLITLKSHGVSDEISMALLKRSSAPAATPAAAPATAAPASVVPDSSDGSVRQYVISGRLDPESYDFFQKYYLMPRTLASVNQTLGYPSVSYGDGFVPYYPPAYGYGYPYSYGIGVAISPGIGRGRLSGGRIVNGFRAR